MAELIPPQCVGIQTEIDGLEAERNELQEELSEAPPSIKPFLLREIRRVNRELGRLRQQLRLCQEQNPPAPRPDLVALTVQLNVNHTTKQLGVAALIRNNGRGNAYGPFRIDLAATLYRSGTTSFVRSFEVPAGITIYGEPVFQGPQLQGEAVAPLTGPVHLPALHHGTEHLPIFSQEYITEYMVIPLYYRDESPSAIYEFEFLVDSERQVSESREDNNRFFSRWWTVRPGAAALNATFQVDLESGTVEQIAE